MKLAYFDCVAGIAGDMALGALIDAGANADEVRAGLSSLALDNWHLHVERVAKCGIAAARAEVHVGGHDAGDAHGVLQTGRGHHEEHQHTRSATEVLEIIQAGSLPDPVCEQACRVFQRLAAAEAKVHGTSLDEVHFHEVGAVDSIVDIVGTVYALHLLGVERVVASPVPTGNGTVSAAHGVMPVPAPATAELLKGVPLRAVDVDGELTTPTGAALLVSLASEFGPLPSMRVESVGYGAGKKDLPFPNVTRVFIGEAEDLPEATTVQVIEANLDDQSPEFYDHIMARLFQAGALDVYLQPIQMKKNRPAQLLTVLARPEDLEALTEIVFLETTTFGLRYSERRRVVLAREWLTVSTSAGEVRVKIGKRHGEVCTISPEYDDCRELAQKQGQPLKRIYSEAAAAAQRQLEGDA